MKNVEDIYAVSPMQVVMLLHTLAHEHDDRLFNQFCFAIDAELDANAFEAAWQRTVAAHAALRTAFVWENVRQPLQIVRETVALPFDILDWRDRADADARDALARYRDEDRRRGFDPRRAPLMRFALMRRAERRWFFVWSSHHLLIDRWCLGTLFADVNRHYREARAGAASPQAPAPSFRGYIDWIAKQDLRHARTYWRDVLRGFAEPTPVIAAFDPRDSVLDNASSSTSDPDALRDFARERGITLSTLVQAAWALTLNRLTRRQDIVFGAAASGRPVDLPGVESIVGSFVNNLPVRVQLDGEARIGDWLKAMQTAQQQRSPYEYLSPADIHRLSDLADGDALFDSLLVWLAPPDAPGPDDLPLTGLSSDFATAYPVTLSVSEDTDGLTLDVARRGVGAPAAGTIVRQLADALTALVASARQTRIAELPGFVAQAGFQPATNSSTGDDRALIDLDMGEGEVGAAAGREGVDGLLLEDLVRAEWQQVLGVEKIGPDDDFFDLGGDSIRAARLQTRLESGTRMAIPMLALFNKPTIREMSATLSTQDWPMTPGISIPLRAHGLGAPLICVASPEVNTIGYSMLTRHLPKRQRVYVLQAPPADEHIRQMHPNELPGLADRYLGALRAVQSTGPYRLLGMCGGAHISLEMAHKLEAAGETVSFVGVVNTWALYTVSWVFYLHRLRNVLRYYRRRIRERLLPPAAPAVQPEQPASAVLAAADIEYGSDNPWIRDVGFASRDPKRPKIKAPLTVFRIRPQQYWRVRDVGLGWSKHAHNVHVVHLPGADHEAILREPEVRHIAPFVGEILSRPGHDDANAPASTTAIKTGATL